MTLQQTSRRLLLACLRSWPASPTKSYLFKQQSTWITAAGSLAAAYVAQQQTAVLAGSWPPGSLRSFADAPGPAEPMIIPLSKQPAPQQSQPAGPPDRNKGPWEKVADQASGGAYWWNTRTGALLAWRAMASGIDTQRYTARVGPCHVQHNPVSSGLQQTHDCWGKVMCSWTSLYIPSNAWTAV